MDRVGVGQGLLQPCSALAAGVWGVWQGRGEKPGAGLWAGALT